MCGSFTLFPENNESVNQKNIMMKEVLALAFLMISISANSQTINCEFTNLQFESAPGDHRSSSYSSEDKESCDFNEDNSENDFLVKVGSQAIPFSVKDIKGNELSLSDLKGKVVAINFWFVDCQPCQLEIPDLNDMVADFENEDVVFIGMALDSKARLKSFLNNNPFLYQVVPNCKHIVTAYGISISPGHVVIGKDSKVKYTSQGLTPETVSNLKKAIKSELSAN